MKKALCLTLSVLTLVTVPGPPSAWAMPKRPSITMQAPREVPSPPSSGEPAWELSDLLKEALAKNPELQAFRERWIVAKARVWQALSWDDTMVGADFEGIPRGRVDADRAMNIEWMISQKIPFPGKRFLKGRVAAKEAKMAESDYQAKEREIVSEVKKAYFEYFLRDHEVRLHEETKRILERLSKSAESRYATGQAAYSEVLRAHTELALITNEVAKHYQQRDTALARLNALLGREAMKFLQVVIAVEDRTTPPRREELMKLAAEHRPELAAMRYGLQAAKTDSKSAWLDLVPDGQVRIEARQFSGEGRIREYDQFLGFEVPVFSLLGRAGQIREKRAAKRAAEKALEHMKNMVLFEVQETWAEFESLDRTVRMYESHVIPQAEAAFETALSDYEGGRGGFLSLMEAQKELTQFRHHYFESLAMREQSFAELERVVGMELGGTLP